MIDRLKFNDNFLKPYGKELVIEVLDIFFPDCDDRMKKLRLNIDELDYSKIAFLACALKGTLQYFEDHEVTNLSRKLEQLGRSETTDGLEETYQELEERLVFFYEELKQIRIELKE